MSLSWKDAAATLLVGAAGVVAYAKIRGFSWPLLASWRVPIIILFTIGLATCILVGSGVIPDKNNWTILATVFGSIAALLLIAGLFIGSKVIFLALMADIVLLWIMATIHHFVEKGA